MKKLAVWVFVMFLAATGRAATEESIAKHWDLLPIKTAEGATLPDAKAAWGKWHFWNGQWWAHHLLQPEAEGPSWEPPKGFDKGKWQQYRGAWLRASKEVPKDWQGGRVRLMLDGIRGCKVRLFVNRKEVATLEPPAAECDLSGILTYGGSNEFLMLLDGGKGGSFKLEKNPPKLVVTAPVSIEDVFANTSWRKKTLTVETEIVVPKDCSALVRAEVFDADGKKVKTLKERFSLNAGTNIVKPFVEWTDPITWELGRGYLYTLKTAVDIGGKTYPYKDVLFGFREIWREKRKIFMNGHEQKYRVTYDFGCNKFGAKFLQGVGYNCIQYAHRTELDPTISEEVLEYLSRNGIAAIEPMCAFDWNTKVPLLKPGEKREKFKRMQAKNLKRYRNWPCIAMMYMGVNCYLPQWSYEARYLGCGDQSEFGEMMKDLVAEAKKTNPNVLYFSHSDGSTGEIASANLYFNWIPLQERVEWPSAWAGETGKFPFQACEFGHPYQFSWYQDKRDLVTELLAIYYGEEAYRTEPKTISDRHVEALYIRRMLHPLYWRFTDDFVTRLTQAWRTFGINAGIVWFNLDYGFGMPGWTLEGIYNKYNPAYNVFKSEAEVPKGRPDWAFPSWDIYRKTNLDFLGWIAGAGEITDRRHAYYVGEKVEKQCALLWDGYEDKVFVAKWFASLDGRRIADGTIERKVRSNVPTLEKIAFEAPAIEHQAKGEIRVTFEDANGVILSEDAFAFEVWPKKDLQWNKAPAFVLFDPSGQTAEELKNRGFVNFKIVASLSEAANAKLLVIAPNALTKDDGYKALQMDEVKKGRRVLVLAQSVEAWRAFGFEVQDRASRILFLRDNLSPALRSLDGSCLHDWSGASPELRTKHARHEPRWTGKMALAALQLKSPTAVGYRPQIEGEFDMNYAALLDYACGKGGVKFCTLDFFGRGATDPAIERTLAAVFADFLFQTTDRAAPSEPCVRAVVAVGAEAQKIVSDTGAQLSDHTQPGAADLLLVGGDAKTPASDVTAAARRGVNVLVVANDALAKALGLTLTPCADDGVYRVGFDPKNPALRGIGQSQLRWRDRLKYSKLSGEGWTIDADGLVASKSLKGGGHIIVTSFDPYAIERGITADRVLVVDGKPRDHAIGEKALADCRQRADISYERSRQLVARLLTNLGAAPAEAPKLYTGLLKSFDPYFYTYW